MTDVLVVGAGPVGLTPALAPVAPSLGQWLDKAPFGPTLGEPDGFGMHY